MPQAVRLWSVSSDSRLEELPRASLDLERQLEDWIAKDISILSPDLLLIDRQVECQGGYIDLLCLDAEGNVVIVELKRDRTTREVIAQVLDYASSVRFFSNEHIQSLAQERFCAPDSLEQAFRKKFGDALPDVLNLRQRMLIVGANLDASTERILAYLSEEHGVDINGATFTHYRGRDGGGFLSRVFVIEPGDLVGRTSKRAPGLSYEELAEQARTARVETLYEAVVEGLDGVLKKATTRSSLQFKGPYQGGDRVVFSLMPIESSAERGLMFQAYLKRLCDLLQLSETEVHMLLPERRTAWAYPGWSVKDADWSGFEGFFQSKSEVQRFVGGVRAAIEA